MDMTTNTAKTITNYNEGLAALKAGQAAYVPCEITDIPSAAIFAGNERGIVQKEYAHIGRSDASYGDAWMRSRDTSITSAWTYYRLVHK